MNFILPLDVLSLRGDSFYDFVEEFCGKEVVELPKFQMINSSVDLIEVDDAFSILQIESHQTTSIKEFLGATGKDNNGKYSFFVMPELQLLTDFTLDFISNMLSNITRSKNLYRYEQSVKDYAVSLYILGGRNVYDFVRLNIPGFIPNLTSLRSILTSSKKYFIEGEFQYERFNEFIELSDCKYAFCGEDSTSVVSKVCYDSRSNSFVGFPLPLKDGFPCSRYFPTNSFGELEQWYEKIDKSFLINVHVIQAVCPSNRTSPSPFLLAAYGTNSKYTARDILNRWSKTFDSFMTQNIRILGFSSDCDPKQMKAMRDSMGFFSNEHTGFECHPDHFKISLFKVSE
ncbi:unnamed protein product [Rotaria socialis]|uniref:Uncharacterized protein n=1 Tax=Rotaria socialis TaxID=392032 RepID=A0A821WVX2_9BILA|nr:unnamed protein product [Rotaria socialis]